MKRLLTILVVLLSTQPVFAQGEAAGQAAVVKPGDNLVLESVPAIPTSIAEKANQYGCSSATSCSASRTRGRRVAR